MPANARKDIVREGEIGTYHCWSRCVQRAFLCGYDPVTGRDFDGRRGWIEDLLAYLARVFAVDVGNFNVLSNHLHAILRTRPDLVALWSAEEVAWRWKLAWPEFRDGQWVREPTDAELDVLLAQPQQIEQIRRRLGSLSWFMARWKEPIARLCNAEMGTSGHFWDARFKSRELLDDQAVLTCSLYVDLNQVRAGMADSLEASRHSAIRQRILTAKEREAHASYEDVQSREAQTPEAFSLAQAQTLFADCYLASIAVEGPLLTTDALRQARVLHGARDRVPASDEQSPQPTLIPPTPDMPETGVTDVVQESSAAPPGTAKSTPQHGSAGPAERSARLRAKLTRLRASDSPFIAVGLAEYLRVVQELARRIVTGRQTLPVTQAGGDQGAEDVTLDKTLARWGLNPAVWLLRFHHLDRQCTRALGTAERVLQRAQAVAQQRFHGVSLCRALFTPSDAFT